jgi:pyruvate/2-oxoglutarate dehydrogenase complex dihydrolipoamide acyltransferase (E2) component
MPRIPIIMPQLGESIAEATIVHLPFKVGDEVQADQDVMEVETQKATMGVTSPCGGTIVEICVESQQSYPVGAVLGYIEVSEADAERMGVGIVPLQDNSPKPAGTMTQPADVMPTVHGLPVPASAGGMAYLSPRMKARMNELGLHAADLAGIAGSGASGRVTIEDLEDFLYRLDEHKQSKASSMRVAVADAMRRSWTRPLATVGRPIALGALLAHRKQQAEKPGPALYILRALAIALGENSAPAGRLIGGKIVHPKAIDIGFAVEAEEGVLVPVLRNADAIPLAKLRPRYDELVDLARQRRLPASAQGGSIATVTNFGTFGLTWATPIPLPEQTLLIGLGAGRMMPHWDEKKGQFVPVMEAEVTLSFDHRVLDGGAAGRMIARIAELLQTPEIL